MLLSSPKWIVSPVYCFYGTYLMLPFVPFYHYSGSILFCCLGCVWILLYGCCYRRLCMHRCDVRYSYSSAILPSTAALTWKENTFHSFCLIYPDLLSGFWFVPAGPYLSLPALSLGRHVHMEVVPPPTVFLHLQVKTTILGCNLCCWLFYYYCITGRADW